MRRIRLRFHLHKWDAVIYGDNDTDYLVNYILKPIGLNGILRNNNEIVLFPVLLLLIIKNIKFFSFFNFKRSFRLIYEMALLDAYNCRVVITFFDDSALFYDLSRIDLKRKYYAIQNGTRFDWHVNAYHKSNFKSIKSEPMIYFSFGDYEMDVFNKFNFNHRTYFPAGSLRASVYMEQKDSMANDRIKYDICLVSAFINNSPIIDNAVARVYRDQKAIYGQKIVDNEYYEVWIKIAENMYRYIKETGKKVVVCLRRYDNPFEQQFFNKYLGKVATIQPRSKFGAYDAINNTNIVVSCGCTTILEALGWNKKLIQIDYTASNCWTSHYVDGFWQLTDNSYEAFKEKLNYINNIDDFKYKEQIKEYADYVMKYDENQPTFNLIRNRIYSDLKTI